MNFVFRDKTTLISNLLTFVHKANYLTKLLNELIVYLRDLGSFHPRDWGLSNLWVDDNN